MIQFIIIITIICIHISITITFGFFGICFGIYSSVFVAAAIAMWLGIQREDLIKGQVVKVEGDSEDPNSGAVV